jgi:transcriptional regulator with XRE-family HTH domain
VAEQAALSFGGLLRQLRAEADLTQEELAEAAGLSPRSVSDLERGINRTARRDTAELLAGALGLAAPVHALFVAAARGRIPAAEVLAAVRGEAGAAPSEDLAAARGLVWPGCPYLGLVPFQERDARVFYGRDELVAQLVRRLAGRLDGTGILLVAGESGAGKSSLLRAGLMPRLAAGALGPGSEWWPRRVMRPTGSPLRELAMLLAEVAGADPVSVYRSLSAAPGEAPMLVEHAVRAAIGRGADPGSDRPADDVAFALPRLVLVVDQFEELFTAGEDAEVGRVEREAFVAALHAAAAVPAGPRKLPQALAVAVVRADFLGRLIASPPLKAALDAGPFTVGPMSEAELRLAMTGPAAEAGLTVEPALVEAVIAELREGAWGGLGSGVLPLMSLAMAATWERREGSELTLRGYRRAGGVADAVNRSAQAAYETLTSPQQDAARWVFTQLTVITPGGQFARRRCSRTDLRSPGAQRPADIDAVIDAFGAQRLLVLGKDGVEISHDVLLQAWKQLRYWLGDDQLDRALYSQVVTDAQTWDSNRRDSSYLYRPGRLAAIDAAITRWQNAPTRYPSLPATSWAFLGAAHLAARRSTWRRRGVIAGLALTLIAVIAAVIAVSDAASVSRQFSIALSRQLVAESLAIASSDPLTAGRLAVAAWYVLDNNQTRSAVMTLLMEQPENGILPGGPAKHGVRGVAFSPDGKLLAAADADGYVQLWSPATRQAVGALLTDAGPRGGVNGVAFSPDGKLLAAADADGTVRVWSLATGQVPRAPRVTFTVTGGVNGVAFSPVGKLLATADADGTLRLWNPATGQPVGAPLQADIGYGVNGVAFSPDGKLLAAAYGDRRVRLWNPATGQAVGNLLTDTSPGGGVNGVAFSPVGKLLATADADGTVRVWSLATGPDPRAPFAIYTVTGGGVNGLAFSPDGKLLAAAYGDHYVRLWNPATGQAVGALLTDADPGGGVNGVAFSPVGKLLATAAADGAVRTLQLSLFADPYAALCTDTGAPTKANWTQYAPGEPHPSVCS